MRTMNGRIKYQFGANELFKILSLIFSIANSGGLLKNKDMSSNILGRRNITQSKSMKPTLGWLELSLESIRSQNSLETSYLESDHLDTIQFKLWQLQSMHIMVHLDITLPVHLQFHRDLEHLRNSSNLLMSLIRSRFMCSLISYIRKIKNQYLHDFLE